MEEQRKVRFLVGGGTIEEYLASLERRKAEQPPVEDDDSPVEEDQSIRP